MNTDPVYLWLVIAVTLAALFPAVAFLVRYHRASNGTWRGNRIGWSLMSLVGMLAAVLTLVLFNNVWTLVTGGGTYFLRPIVGLFLYLGLALGLWKLWLTYEEEKE